MTGAGRADGGNSTMAGRGKVYARTNDRTVAWLIFSPLSPGVSGFENPPSPRGAKEALSSFSSSHVLQLAFRRLGFPARGQAGFSGWENQAGHEGRLVPRGRRARARIKAAARAALGGAGGSRGAGHVAPPPATAPPRSPLRPREPERAELRGRRAGLFRGRGSW